MKLPSIKELSENAGAGFSRFPFVIIGALFAALAHSLDISGIINTELYQRLLLIATLTITGSAAVAIIAEKKEFNKSKSIVLQAIISVVWIVVVLLSSSSPEALIKLLLMNIVQIGIFTSVPFYGSKKSAWNFNKSAVIAALTGLFFGVIITLMGMMALIAMERLLNVLQAGTKAYGYLSSALLTIIPFWIFAAKLKSKEDIETESYDYPKIIKNFSLYVALTFTLLYLIIIYLYGIKIIIKSDLPDGVLTWLILSFACVGVLTHTLLSPGAEDKAAPSALFSKYFYFALIPVLVLETFAIYRRLAEYGPTVDRLFVVAIILWLFILCLYYIFSKSKKAAFTELSLAVGLALAIIPIFSISKSYQTGKLIQELQSLDLKNKIVTKTDIFIASKRFSALVSNFNYLTNTHNSEDLIETVNAVLGSKLIYSKYESGHSFLKDLNIYESKSDGSIVDNDNLYFETDMDNITVADLSSGRYLLSLNNIIQSHEVYCDDSNLKAQIIINSKARKLTLTTTYPKADTIVFDLNSTISKIQYEKAKGKDDSFRALAINAQGSAIKGVLIINRFNIVKPGKENEKITLSGNLLLENK